MKRGVFVLMSFFAAGCMEGDIYDLDALSNETLSKGIPRVLSFQLRSESLYYTPGARREKSADVEVLTIVRCKVGKTCAVDLPVRPNPQGEVYQIELPADAAAIVRIKGKSAFRSVPPKP